MTDVWESQGLVTETWESNTTPGVQMNVVVRDGELSPGAGDLPSGAAGQLFRIADDGETVEVVTPNTPGGPAVLDDDGTLPDILGPSSFARDTEVAAAIAAGAVVLVDLHLPLAIEFVGGSFTDANTATLPSAAGEAAGVALLWTEQGTGSNNDIWVHQGGGEFVRSSPAALRSARVGTLIVSRANPLIGFAPQVLRIDAANSVEELVVTAAQVDALIAAAIAAFGDDTLHDALTAASYALDPPEAWFECTGGDASTTWWESADIPPLANGPDMRALLWFNPSEAAAFFYEVWTLFFDDGTGDDSPEAAIHKTAAGAKPRAYLESVRGGDTVDETDATVEVDIEKVWAALRWYIDLDNDQAVVQQAVRWGGDTVTADGMRWRTWITMDRPPGIEWNLASVWKFLLRFPGRAAWGKLYDGVDGTLVAFPNAADWESGTSFLDTVGREWTTIGGTVAKPAPRTQAGVQALIDAAVAALLDGAPGALNTLNELAAALNDDASFAASVTTALAGKVPTTRTLAGLDLSADRGAAALRAALGQAWQTIDLFTFTGAESSRTVNVTGFNRIRLTLSGRSTRAATTENIRMTLNGNTGNVYGVNASALAAFWALGVIPAATTNTDRGGLLTVELQLHSGLTKAGWSMNQQSIVSTSVVGSAVTTTGLFSTITAAVTTLELFAQTAAFAAGSVLLVEGC